jgi:hypothetical protein
MSTTIIIWRLVVRIFQIIIIIIHSGFWDIFILVVCSAVGRCSVEAAQEGDDILWIGDRSVGNADVDWKLLLLTTGRLAARCWNMDRTSDTRSRPVVVDVDSRRVAAAGMDSSGGLVVVVVVVLLF